MTKKQTTEEERAKNREKQRKYREKHKDRIKNNRNIYMKKSVEKRLLWASRKRSKEKNLEHTITEKDIIVPEKCPYLGIKLENHVARGNPRTNIASLDRIDSSKGYTPDNIEVISHLANTMKSNATKEQLIEFAKTILSRYGKTT